MADSKSYQQTSQLTPIFQSAAERQIKSVDELAEILNVANYRFDQWPDDLKNSWVSGLTPIFEDGMAGAELSPEMRRLLRAMLDCGIDAPAFRNCYVALAKALFPNCTNIAGVITALGFNSPNVPVINCARRLKIFENLKTGDCCIDVLMGNNGYINKIDLDNCVVKFVANGVQSERRLENFLQSMTLIRDNSFIANLIRKNNVENFASRKELDNAAKACIITLDKVTSALINKILVPNILTQNEFVRLCGSNNAEESAADEAADNGDDIDINLRWDYSHSLVEMEARLQDKDCKLEADNLNWSNVERMLERDVTRADRAHCWANIIAILQKGTSFSDKLQELLARLAPRAIAWSDMDLFVAITDKMTGKLAPQWLSISRNIKGNEFLVESTIRMPYRLWTITEKILEANKAHDLFSARVFQSFRENKPLPDHYVWLWKAPNSEERTKYLANSYLLFKVLHVDRKGNYLKSQRLVHRMLTDDDTFLRAVAKQGDPAAIENLIRCTKHLQLLDASERQALLVKIARLFPESKKAVTDNAGAKQTVQSNNLRLTSVRSYAKAKRDLLHLREELIPANTAAIEEARSHGDLSENSEYKYAKEQQRLLNNRLRDLEATISSIRPTDFRDLEVSDTVIPGTVVTLNYTNSGRTQEITLLGLLDGDSARGIFSYDSPMGRVLRLRKVGDHLTVPAGEAAVVTSVQRLPQALLDEIGKED